MSARVSDAELLAELGGALDGAAIVGVERRPYRYATSAPLEEVRLVLDGGEEALLILKDMARDRLLGDAPAAKPEFLYEPRREARTYRAILASAGIGPRCFAAVEREGRCWILIEKAPGVELWQVGDMDVWAGVARWLGGFHGRFSKSPEELRKANPYLLDYSSGWFRSWRDRARAALERASDPRAAALGEALGRYEAVLTALASLPRSLVHGELYPSNVLVDPESTPRRVYPVDWEMAGVGPGLLDLAALAGGYGEAERRPLAEAYAEGLAESGATVPAALEEGLAACRMHLAMQWLGWAEGWRPPPEHAHDWLGEAAGLALELGL